MSNVSIMRSIIEDLKNEKKESKKEIYWRVSEAGEKGWKWNNKKGDSGFARTHSMAIKLAKGILEPTPSRTKMK